MSWSLRRLYEESLTPKGAWIDPSIYSRAFPQVHNIEGHSVKCIFARPKHEKFTHSPTGSGVYETRGVLYVEERELSGLRYGESLRVDGEVYLITGLSRPVIGMLRAELSAGAE